MDAVYYHEDYMIGVYLNNDIAIGKVNSVQEACAKCFAVHLLKFEILQTTRKNKTKNIKMLHLLVKKVNTKQTS